MTPINPEVDGRTCAERFREEHRLGVQPIGDLITVIDQNTQIDVAILDVGPDEHGLTMRDPIRDMVFIGVARTTRPMRQRSTLAHELGHVLFKDGKKPDSDDFGRWSPEETRATAFARHLLIPHRGLLDYLGNPAAITVDQRELSAVVQRFLVSPAIAAIALCQAGYINEHIKSQWQSTDVVSTPKLAARFGWRDQYQALAEESNTRRAPQKLLARAVAGYELGVVSSQAIARIRGISSGQVEEELLSAGIEPVKDEVLWGAASDLPDPSVDLAQLDADLAEPPGENL
ncbi:ImmA/IrrE family metallo-endopeptidase [Nocardia alni]|uniref:ImmA/IrrE family metallo-endopeptidase n=1 Tax=Nocardia alni TaxID=2815723 RepID=UPI001C250614|nr:ImmA/IrrE family metallo-endopeptidase [Nocardia alni]